MNLNPCLSGGRMAEQGRHLYFIEMVGCSRVKIGRGNNPQARLKTLQVGSPYKLKLLGVVENCGADEAEFHRLLRGCWIRGEWFHWSDLVEETIELALAGGDWREPSARLEPQVADDDSWWIGSPLYQGNPNYPQYQARD
jgi:hypothetical protein